MQRIKEEQLLLLTLIGEAEELCPFARGEECIQMGLRVHLY